MVLTDLTDFENVAYTYTFGIVGIVFIVLFLVFGIIFLARKTELNYTFGYRSFFSLSSNDRWNWCNKVFFNSIFIFEPLFLIAHIVIFVLSIVYNWSFAYVTISMACSLVFLIPVTLFIEIYGRIKFPKSQDEPIKPLVENEKSKKQDIDDFWS